MHPLFPYLTGYLFSSSVNQRVDNTTPPIARRQGTKAEHRRHRYGYRQREDTSS
ncbi:hypothetical protein [Musicola paradisiaca]|uniref:hypothetical protein n=1 Tax=Musicola paradisiaca TaxID=69223 RepID=UPI0002F2A112|nr:hypothetical protein [Musicola paradisiaca]